MQANGDAIAAIRERTGLTKTQLAKACDPPIDRTHLHRIESGERNATAAQIRSIAVALMVPTTAIINATAEVA